MSKKPTKKAAPKKVATKPAVKKTAAKKPNAKKGVTFKINLKKDIPAAHAEQDEHKKPAITQKTFYRYGIVRGVKFDVGKDGKLTRLVAEKFIECDRDLDNEPKAVAFLKDEIEQGFIRDGYLLSDQEAMDSVLRQIEGTIDDLRHETEYHGICQRRCITGMRFCTESLRYIREFKEMVLAKLKNISNVPAVLPEKRSQWKIHDGKFVDYRDSAYKAKKVTIVDGVKLPVEKIKNIIKDQIGIWMPFAEPGVTSEPICPAQSQNCNAEPGCPSQYYNGDNASSTRAE